MGIANTNTGSLDAAVEEGLLPESVLTLHEQAFNLPGQAGGSGKNALDQSQDLALFASSGVPGTGPREQLFDDLMAPRHLPPPVHLAMLPPPPTQFYSVGPPPQQQIQPVPQQSMPPSGPAAMDHDRRERDPYREREQRDRAPRRDNYDDRRGGGQSRGGYRERYD